jgi:hypothetical protein
MGEQAFAVADRALGGFGRQGRLMIATHAPGRRGRLGR